MYDCLEARLDQMLTPSQPDIKKLQIQLTGFLDKDTPRFCKELWNLCLSAQTSPQGVPKELLEAKKLELIQEKVCWCRLRSWVLLLTFPSLNTRDQRKMHADDGRTSNIVSEI